MTQETVDFNINKLTNFFDDEPKELRGELSWESFLNFYTHLLDWYGASVDALSLLFFSSDDYDEFCQWVTNQPNISSQATLVLDQTIDNGNGDIYHIKGYIRFQFNSYIFYVQKRKR